MKNQKGYIQAAVLYIIIWFVAVIGWGMNVYKLTTADFEPSYKNEIIRSIGVVVAPVGAITGYINIED